MKKIIKRTELLLSFTNSRDTDESLFANPGNHYLEII